MKKMTEFKCWMSKILSHQLVNHQTISCGSILQGFNDHSCKKNHFYCKIVSFFTLYALFIHNCYVSPTLLDLMTFKKF